ncbi:MAG: aconitase X [Ilumatobacteraceae bacterium]
MAQNRRLDGTPHVSGTAAGRVLFADTGVSFMGGVSPVDGRVIDIHHPLHGESVAGQMLVLPSGRGSCAGSLGIFELLLNGHAPRALIFRGGDTILTLGVLIARELFDRGIPVVGLTDADFELLSDALYVIIDGGSVTLTSVPPSEVEPTVTLGDLDLSGFTLTARDRMMLRGAFGAAAATAMRIIIRTAQLEGATDLVDVEMAHIDGCFYHGPGVLAFVNALRDLGATVRVPSTMNSLCVDRRLWREQGVPQRLGAPSDEVAEAYIAMGVTPTYTCAPYLLDPAPAFGQQIAWGESNAVVFANSVLGARTLKYPDYLDILVAITGRAPNADCHTIDGRHATVRVDVPTPREPDDAYFALLGHHLGMISPNDIPVVCGLETVSVSRDDLKAFGAAFATTSAVAMFHIAGITPEAPTVDAATGPHGASRRLTVTNAALEAAWHQMTTATDSHVDLVAVGNPHFSLTECGRLADRLAGRKKSDKVSLMVTCGREVKSQADAAGYVDVITNFGGTIINDTCWCLICEPVIPTTARSIATNSGKYAHYGPAAVSQAFHFASLDRCVEAACTGQIDTTRPTWLQP